MSFTPIASDSFNRADDFINAAFLDNALGGSGSNTWSAIYGSSFNTVSNRGVQIAGTGLNLEAPNSLPDSTDCRVTGVCYGPNLAAIGVALRYNTSTGFFYAFIGDNTQSRIFYVDFGYNVIVSGGPALATGDSLVLVAAGQVLTGTVNGGSAISVTDPNIATGKPAIYSEGNGAGFDSFLYETGTASATPTKLGITTALVGNQSGVAFSTQPVVAVQDAGGSTVTTDTSTVTATLNTLTGSGTLGGTTTKAAVAGVADFSGTGMKVTGTGSFTITYSDGALATVTTPTFYVGATAVHITSQATTAYTQRAHGNVVVAVRDGGGTTVGNATNSITIALTVLSGSAVLTSGTTTQSASSGVVTYSNLLVTCTDGATWTYAVSSSGLTGDTSSPLTGTVRSLDVTDVNT